MFGRTKKPTTPDIHFHEHKAPPSERHVTVREETTIHEHRAPTDESVRLILELEQAARDRIIDSVNVTSTVFDCVIQSFFSHDQDALVLCAIFSIGPARPNDKITVEHHIRGMRSATSVPASELLALRDKVAMELASIMINDAWTAMAQKPFR